MATWNDLRGYIHSAYKVENEEPGNMTLRFGLANGRSQLVFVSHAEMSGLTQEQWVQICSGIAELSTVRDIRAVLNEISTDVVGGLSIVGDFLVIRHSIPLADMSVEEFESPLSAVMNSADFLENMLTGQDRV